MDVRLINPFVSAIRNVFKTMLQTEVSFDKPSVKTTATPCMDVSCVIGFSGDATGCVVLCFANDVACKVAGKFAGAQLDVSHPDFADALGELTNIVAGNAKKDIPNADITISLPNVVIGSNHSISPSKSTPHVLIPCKTSLGNFTLEVGMRVEKTARTARPVVQGAGA